MRKQFLHTFKILKDKKYLRWKIKIWNLKNRKMINKWKKIKKNIYKLTIWKKKRKLKFNQQNKDKPSSNSPSEKNAAKDKPSLFK